MYIYFLNDNTDLLQMSFTTFYVSSGSFMIYYCLKFL